MLVIKLDGIEKVERMLGDLAHKYPSAVARGLTATAKDVQGQLLGWLPRLLDRPTPYTMRSTFVFPAEKDDLRAAVGFKSEFGRLSRNSIGDVDASRSMRAQVYGGQRKLKASESTLLNLAGITSQARPYLIPAKGAKLDRYGNVPGSFMNRVLFSGVSGGSAEMSKALDRGRSQATTKRGQYFVMRKDGVAVGIYRNQGKRPPMPVFIFSAKAIYRTRVPFASLTKSVAQRQLDKRIAESVDVIIKKYRG